MLAIDPAQLQATAAYRLITGIVVPRPIAWVSTLNQSGSVNLAPFSCYTFVSHQPILIGISIGRRPGGRKDTAVNIHRDGEFVLNVAHESEAALVHRSSEALPPAVSEVEMLGLETSSSKVVRAPRLTTSPVALECILDQVVTFGDDSTEFFVARVARVHVREELYRDGKIETDQLQPLVRVAGPNYSKVESVARFSSRYQLFSGERGVNREDFSGT